MRQAERIRWVLLRGLLRVASFDSVRCCFQGLIQLVHVDWFRQARIHARFAEAMFVFCGGVPAEADDDLMFSRCRFALSNCARGFQSGHARHFFVQQQNVKVVVIERVENVAAVSHASSA